MADVHQDDSIDRSRQKTAGATLYLIEELGDARLNCDHLIRYLTEAVKLIEKSSHKDHFFEVAGHLIRAVPQTAFKLQKSLQAVALAAGRIDYEELKQELRPEKVDELERVLKEVRIRPVQHRSENPMLTPKYAADRLRDIARQTRAEGYAPTRDIAAFVQELDPNRQASGALPVADALDKLAGAMESQGHVSRGQLATLLSRIAMEQEFEQTFKLASRDKQAMTDDSGLEPDFESIRTNAIAASRAASTGRWRPALLSLYYIVDDIGTVLVKLGSMDTQKSEQLKREIRQMLPQAAKTVEEMSHNSVMATADQWRVEADSDIRIPALFVRHQKNISDQLDELNHSLSTWAKDKQKYHPQLQNALDASKAIQDSSERMVRELNKIESEVSKTASDADDKLSRYEEGKPADPTENMNQEDAEEWKENTEEHKDKFKTAGALV